jgi:hypothetical protein
MDETRETRLIRAVEGELRSYSTRPLPMDATLGDHYRRDADERRIVRLPLDGEVF